MGQLLRPFIPVSQAPEPPVSPATPAARTIGRRSSRWPWLFAVILLALIGWAGWQGWLLWQERQREAVIQSDQRVDALAERLSALRNDQRAQAQRLKQADATNRVLRDELLGLSERAALLEQSLARYSEPDRHGALALRLDEAELLLALGEQRLLVAGDLDGGRRAYALAASALERIDDPEYMNLRQALMQERAALEAVERAPRAHALAQLEALALQLDAAPDPEPQDTEAVDAPWWRRIVADLIRIRPSDGAVAMEHSDRAAAWAGLQLEISLARAAAERGDQHGWRNALERIELWLMRLWPPSSAREAWHAELAALAATPLSLSLPSLGSTLRELRRMRAAQ